MDDKRLNEIIAANKEKDFVKRILKPTDYPKYDLGEGNFGTHLMSWGEHGGKYIVFPTIVNVGGFLKRYFPKHAFDYALETGEYIEFDNAEDAEQFSKEYKRLWQ